MVSRPKSPLPRRTSPGLASPTHESVSIRRFAWFLITPRNVTTSALPERCENDYLYRILLNYVQLLDASKLSFLTPISKPAQFKINMLETIPAEWSVHC